MEKKITSDDFACIPIDFLRNPNISANAKTILCILLSNKAQWNEPPANIIPTMMKEGKNTITNGVKELVALGYLKIIIFQDKQTKKIYKTTWEYTDIPNTFIGLDEYLEQLNEMGYEVMVNNSINKKE